MSPFAIGVRRASASAAAPPCSAAQPQQAAPLAVACSCSRGRYLSSQLSARRCPGMAKTTSGTSGGAALARPCTALLGSPPRPTSRLPLPRRCALMGDKLGRLAEQNGWAGVVVHGCVRDVAALAQLNVGIKAVAPCPVKSSKRDPGLKAVRQRDPRRAAGAAPCCHERLSVALSLPAKCPPAALPRRRTPSQALGRLLARCGLWKAVQHDHGCRNVETRPSTAPA